MEQTLSEALKARRERDGISARLAAKELGVAPGTYEGWEKGWRTPQDRKHHEAISDWLGVPVAVVLGWSGLLSEEEVRKLIR